MWEQRFGAERALQAVEHHAGHQRKSRLQDHQQAHAVKGDLKGQQPLWLQAEHARLAERGRDAIELHLELAEVGADPLYVRAVLRERISGRPERNRHLLQLVGAAVELRRNAGQRLKAENRQCTEVGAEAAEGARRVVRQLRGLVGRAACVVDALLEVGGSGRRVTQRSRDRADRLDQRDALGLERGL